MLSQSRDWIRSISAIPWTRWVSRKTIKESRAKQYRIIKRIVAPEANRFFLSPKDCHQWPKLISVSNQQWIKSKRKFLLILVFLAIQMTESQLQGVRDTGNKTDREDYEHFLNNEAAHFSILKDFCESVGSSSAAISVQKNVSFGPNWWLGSRVQLQLYVHASLWRECITFSLCEIIFAIIEIYLAPETWEGRKAIDPPPLDAHVNLIQYIQILTSSIQFNYSKLIGCCLNISSFVRLK